MASGRTELSPQDKGKILAYMENFNPSQIAKKIGCDPTTLLTNIKRQGKLKIYQGLNVLLFLIMIKKVHL